MAIILHTYLVFSKSKLESKKGRGKNHILNCYCLNSISDLAIPEFKRISLLYITPSNAKSPCLQHALISDSPQSNCRVYTRVFLRMIRRANSGGTLPLPRRHPIWTPRNHPRVNAVYFMLDLLFKFVVLILSILSMRPFLLSVHLPINTYPP